MKAKIINKIVAGLVPEIKPYEVWDEDISGFVLRVQPTGRMVYYFSYRNSEGKRHRFRIGTHGTVTPAQARDVAEKLSGKVALGEDVHESRKEERQEAVSRKTRTLRSFLEDRYGPWVKSQRRRGRQTVKDIEREFEHLMDKSLEEITLWDMEKWRAARRKAEIKAATVNRNVVALKALLSKAVEWNVIETHPLARLKPLKVDDSGKVRYLTDKEEKRLRAALEARESKMREARESHNRWRALRKLEPLPVISVGGYADHLAPMVLLSINTGLRRGEVFHLRWEDVSFAKATLTVAGETAKSGRTRHVPLNAEALAVLKKWRKSANAAGLVFPGDNGAPFDNVKKSWMALLKDAGIKNFRWHDMRHHFASRLVMAGVDLNTVRELLGHSTLDMTLRYAHLAPEHKAEAVSRLLRRDDAEAA